jgi:hypothetical protein
MRGAKTCTSCAHRFEIEESGVLLRLRSARREHKKNRGEMLNPDSQYRRFEPLKRGSQPRFNRVVCRQGEYADEHERR